jgi:hypothetical protein
VDPDLAFGVPLALADDGEVESMRALIATAAPWFLGRGAPLYVVELPAERAALRRVFLETGRILWRRRVFVRPLGERDAGPADTSGMRAYRPRDSGDIHAIYADRFPAGRPTPIPVPFVPLPVRSWSPTPPPAIDTRLWVLERSRRVLGVVGVTPHGPRTTGDIGPFLTDSSASLHDRVRLLSVGLEWLRRRFAHQARASFPEGDTPESEALKESGFECVAESDLAEIRA